MNSHFLKLKYFSKPYVRIQSCIIYYKFGLIISRLTLKGR